jgi:hypothetical protein
MFFFGKKMKWLVIALIVPIKRSSVQKNVAFFCDMPNLQL